MVKKLLPFIILTGLILIFFRRLFFPTLSLFMIPDFGESDVLHLNLPFKFILSESLKNGQWPLWSPFLANGFPLLAEGQIGTFYLPNLLLFRFLPLVWAYNLNLVIAFFLASTGMYLFTKRIGLSSISSFFAAFIFTFSGFLAVHLNHFNLVQAASLLPLIFWSALVLWGKPKLKYSILTAFFISQQIFTGHFYIVFITFVGLAIFLLGVSSRNDNKIRLFFLSISLIIAFLFSAIQLLPTIELWQLSARKSGLDFDTVTQYPYPINNLITFIKPYAFGNPANGSYPPFNSDWGIFWENTAYVGLLPLLLVCISIFFIKNRIVKTFLVILFVALLLVLGKNSPLYFIFSFPLFNMFRVPSKFLLLTVFSISILSAFSIDKLLNFLKKLTPICGGLILLILLFDEYKFSYNYPPATPALWWTTSPEISKLIPPKSTLISSTAPILWNKVFKSSGWQDFAPYVYFKNSLYPNYNALFSIRQADINTGGLVPRRLSLFNSLFKNITPDEDKNEAIISSSAKNILSLAGVDYIVSAYKLNNTDFSLKAALPLPPEFKLDPLLLYFNKQARPPGYIVFNSKKLETLEEFNTQLASENFLGSDTVMVEDDALKINNSNKKITPVNFIAQKSDEVILKYKSDTDGILVLTDTNYPGWKAGIDKSPVKIYNVNLIQRGILAPAGDYEVIFNFYSDAFENGKKITVAAWLIISLAVFLSSSVFRRRDFCKNQLLRGLCNKLHNLWTLKGNSGDLPYL